MKSYKLSSMILAVAVVCCAVVAQAVTHRNVTRRQSGQRERHNGYGAVDHNYNIGKYEVTVGQ